MEAAFFRKVEGVVHFLGLFKGQQPAERNLFVLQRLGHADLLERLVSGVNSFGLEGKHLPALKHTKQLVSRLTNVPKAASLPKRIFNNLGSLVLELPHPVEAGGLSLFDEAGEADNFLLLVGKG